MSRGAVLVLDGHTTQALACVRSLGLAGYPVLVASHRRWPLAAWSQHCRGELRLGAETVEAFGAMRRWAADRGVRFVLPLTERTCRLCNAERAQWEALGVTVGCGEDEMLLRAFDKAQTLAGAESCGLRVPPTRLPQSEDECLAAAAELGYPCVIKPRFSNAWIDDQFLPAQGPAYVGCATELLHAVRTRRQGSYWPLLQGVVAGQGRGIFGLYDHGRAVAWFAHERLRDVRPSGSGSSLRRSAALSARLLGPAERLLSAMNWHGPAMVEFRDEGSGPPCLMEVNGRFWGSLQLAVAAGVDFPRLWLEILAGSPPPPQVAYTEGVTLRWLWGDVKRFAAIMLGPPARQTTRYPGRFHGVRELLGPQPPGTRLETWQRADPWPAVGEWVQGLEELVVGLRPNGRAERVARTNGNGRASAVTAGEEGPQ